MSPQYGELRPTSSWHRFRSLGHPSKFQRVHVLAAFLQRCRSTEANQTLHDVWPSPGLVQDIYIFGSSCPLTEFHYMQNSLCVQVLHFPTLASLLHGTPAAGSAKHCGVVQGMELRNFRRGRHLYLAGRPLRWASAHILVMMFVLVLIFVPVQLFWMANCTIIVTCAWQVSYVMLRNHCSVCQHNFSTSCGWIFIKCGLWVHVGVGNSSLDFEYGRFNIRNSASRFLPWVRNY